MTLSVPIDSPLQNQLSAACPRGDSVRAAVPRMNSGGAFKWRECAECDYLWAIPYGWTPHGEPDASPLGE